MIKGLSAALVNMIHERCNSIFDGNVKTVMTAVYSKKFRHKYYVKMEHLAQFDLYEHYDSRFNFLATFCVSGSTVGAVSKCIEIIIKDRERSIKEEAG